MQMKCGAVPAPGDQLADRAHRQLAVDRQRQIDRYDLRDGDEIEERIVAQALEEVRLKRELRRGSKQQYLLVRRGILDGLGADASACAGTVVDDHGPAEPRLQVFGKQPRNRISGSSRRKRKYDLERLFSGKCGPRRKGQSGKAGQHGATRVNRHSVLQMLEE